MTVARIRSRVSRWKSSGNEVTNADVNDLLYSTQDFLGVNRDEAESLLHVATENPDLLSARQVELIEYFARRQLASTTSPHERLVGIPRCFPRICILGLEGLQGTLRQFFRNGSASPEAARVARENALNSKGSASFRKVPAHADVGEIETAIKRCVDAIDGFAFLDRAPEGASQNRHTVLIKPGVNWGFFGYPTVSSWESVYVATKLTFEEASRRGADAAVIVGDQSGIENMLWCGSTLYNMDRNKILHGAVRAGIERAADLDAQEPGRFPESKTYLRWIEDGNFVSLRDIDLIHTAESAGVRVVGFEDVKHVRLRFSEARHFVDGILFPELFVNEVTDLINLPKPPGRHIVMGNTGCSGAIKNLIGLMGASDRCPALHGRTDRYPAFNDGSEGSSFVDEARQMNAMRRKDPRAFGEMLRQKTKFNWDGHGPGRMFHEKVFEIYLAVKDKMRFSLTDARRAVSSFGPDLGHTIDTEAVIASADPLSLDLIGAAVLKRAYERDGGFWKRGGNRFSEYFMGKTWLRKGVSPFDLTSAIAAFGYGVGPIDFEQLDIVGEHGFAAEDIDRINAHLRGDRIDA